MKKLYLDDVRVPPTEGWDIVRSYDQFVAWIRLNELPDLISFDHDLEYDIDNPAAGVEINDDNAWYYAKEDINAKTGYDCAKWLVQYCIDNKVKLPQYYCHSMNPVGKENILKLLHNYEKTYSLD